MLHKRVLSAGLAAILALIALPVSAAPALVDAQGPITSGVGTSPVAPSLGDLVTLIANVDDTTTGGSTISSG